METTYPGFLVCSAEEVPTHPHVDLVVIASPNESHFPLAAAALRAGKDGHLSEMRETIADVCFHSPHQLIEFLNLWAESLG
ncbi:MAG: Gfo/Idh/MocA family oxidoreductase [Alloacidobacterium sp.]